MGRSVPRPIVPLLGCEHRSRRIPRRPSVRRRHPEAALDAGDGGLHPARTAHCGGAPERFANRGGTDRGRVVPVALRAGGGVRFAPRRQGGLPMTEPTTFDLKPADLPTAWFNIMPSIVQ